jgi:hypothetical protein
MAPPFYILAVVVLAAGGIPKGTKRTYNTRLLRVLTESQQDTMKAASVPV